MINSKTLIKKARAHFYAGLNYLDMLDAYLNGKDEIETDIERQKLFEQIQNGTLKDEEYEKIKKAAEQLSKDVSKLNSKNKKPLKKKYIFKGVEELIKEVKIYISARVRKDGRLEGRFWRNGKQISVYGKTEEELSARLKDAITKPMTFIKPKRTNPNMPYLFDWIERYIKEKEKEVSESTLNGLNYNFSKHIKNNFANKPLGLYSTLEIENSLNKIESDRMRQITQQLIKAVFKEAQRLEITKTNKAENLKTVKHKQVKGSALSAEEIKEFSESIKGILYENYYLFLLNSGCRRNEALDLKWSDIDYKNAVIQINGTKTESSKRRLPLFDVLKKILSNTPKTSESIFPFNANHITTKFKELCPKHKLHDLRHTFTTMCRKKGVEMQTTKEWLGHSDIKTTSNIYMHSDAEINRKEAEKFNKKPSDDTEKK